MPFGSQYMCLNCGRSTTDESGFCDDTCRRWYGEKLEDRRNERCREEALKAPAIELQITRRLIIKVQQNQRYCHLHCQSFGAEGRCRYFDEYPCGSPGHRKRVKSCLELKGVLVEMEKNK